MAKAECATLLIDYVPKHYREKGHFLPSGSASDQRTPNKSSEVENGLSYASGRAWSVVRPMI